MIHSRIFSFEKFTQLVALISLNFQKSFERQIWISLQIKYYWTLK